MQPRQIDIPGFKEPVPQPLASVHPGFESVFSGEGPSRVNGNHHGKERTVGQLQCFLHHRISCSLLLKVS
jgi:hypothetical protein